MRVRTLGQFWVALWLACPALPAVAAMPCEGLLADGVIDRAHVNNTLDLASRVSGWFCGKHFNSYSEATGGTHDATLPVEALLIPFGLHKDHKNFTPAYRAFCDSATPTDLLIQAGSLRPFVAANTSLVDGYLACTRHSGVQLYAETSEDPRSFLLVMKSATAGVQLRDIAAAQSDGKNIECQPALPGAGTPISDVEQRYRCTRDPNRATKLTITTSEGAHVISLAAHAHYHIFRDEVMGDFKPGDALRRRRQRAGMRRRQGRQCGARQLCDRLSPDRRRARRRDRRPHRSEEGLVEFLGQGADAGLPRGACRRRRCRPGGLSDPLRLLSLPRGKRPPPLGDGRPQHVVDMAGAARQHDEAVEAERDAGTFRHAMRQRREEILVDRIGDAVARLLVRLIGVEAAALRRRIGELAEGIGELETADIELEALGQARLLRLGSRQRRHGDRIIVEDGRRADAERRLDALEKDAEEQILPGVAGMRGDAERPRRGGEQIEARRQRFGRGRQQIDAAKTRERFGDAQILPGLRRDRRYGPTR